MLLDFVIIQVLFDRNVVLVSIPSKFSKAAKLFEILI